MKKRGFTLAEVLITLGIIGVVAALTAPALVQNANSAKVGPKLAKAVSTFELANEAMLNEAGVSSIKGMGFSTPEAYIKELSNYMRISYSKSNESYSTLLTSYSGKPLGMISLYDDNKEAEKYENEIKYDPLVMGSYVGIAKDGTLYGIEFTNDSSSSLKPHLSNFGAVTIDINGYSEPNKLGKDAFVFVLKADGSLEPFGSNGLWNTSSYEKCNANSVGTGSTCSASIFENDLKVIYQ